MNNFAERVREFVEEDESSSSAEKVAASEGRRNVLRLLYQLCPGAAPKSQPAPRKACDFESLYVASDSAQVAEGSPTLFHRVTELIEDHQARFRAAGKAVSSALPVYQGEGFGRGDSGSSLQGSGGACASDFGLLQQHVCRDQSYGGVGGRSSTSQL